MQNSWGAKGSTFFQAWLGKPLECSLIKPGVLEIDGYEIVVCECPNNIYGCKWKGELNHYLLDHQKRCNFQVVQCYCGNQMYKGYFAHHLSSECKHRLVDYKRTYELDDMYGNQRCPRWCYGCKWYGTCTRYHKVHAYQCMYQDVLCYCQKLIKKCFLAEHIVKNCDLRLDLQPGMNFSDFSKPDSDIEMSHVEGTFEEGIEEKMDTTEPNEEKAMDVDE